MSQLHTIKAVLFDLDGTLVDSAPDLGAAADKMRIDRGLESIPLANYRPLAGAGARGMLQIAFNMKPTDANYPAMREEFFRNYEAIMTVNTHPFEGVEKLIKTIEETGIPWGIVTNKMERFFLPFMASTDWVKSAKARIAGDTTAHAKPHPLPVLTAAKQLNIAPEYCLYVGDDIRDIQSGNAAGMLTAAATWGYLGEQNDVTTWQADYIITKASDLYNLLKLPSLISETK